MKLKWLKTTKLSCNTPPPYLLLFRYTKTLQTSKNYHFETLHRSPHCSCVPRWKRKSQKTGIRNSMVWRVDKRHRIQVAPQQIWQRIISVNSEHLLTYLWKCIRLPRIDKRVVIQIFEEDCLWKWGHDMRTRTLFTMSTGTNFKIEWAIYLKQKLSILYLLTF